MKKATLILTVLCMSFLIFSCSKKDKTEPEGSGSNNNQKEQLQLTASSTEVKEGSEVTFEVTADGNTVTADIYINTNKISGSSYTFDQAGEYTVIAKKDGYPNSEGLKITVKAPVLFMAGYTSVDSHPMATYWKDGTAVQLGDGSKHDVSGAFGIAVDNGDVYVAGFVANDGGPITAVYWKNGEMTELGSPGMAYDIAIHDGKVIAVGVAGDVNGSGNQEAVKWEDGSKFVFHEDEITAMLAITTDDQKVYTTGIYQDNNGDAATFFWRDIDGYFLDDGIFFQYNPFNDGLMSVAVKDEDVYVAGPFLGANDGGYATYWKNGNPIALNTGTGLGAADGVTVSDGDVYISGVIDSHKTNSGYALAYWKNEQLHETSEDNFIHGDWVDMTSIAVNDGKVYMAGKDMDGVEGSILYKDGVRKELDGAFIYNITIGYE